MNRELNACNIGILQPKSLNAYCLVVTLHQFGVLCKRYRNTKLPKTPKYTKNTEITCNFGKRHTWVKLWIIVIFKMHFIYVDSNWTDIIHVPTVGSIRNIHAIVIMWLKYYRKYCKEK